MCLVYNCEEQLRSQVGEQFEGQKSIKYYLLFSAYSLSQ